MDALLRTDPNFAKRILPETLISTGPPKWHEDYRGRELDFIRDVLGLRHPRTGVLQMWEFQRYLVRALMRHRRVVVTSSRSTSKTHTLGHLIPAFLYCEPSRVIVVGPTLRQIMRGAMGTARDAMLRANRPLFTASGKTSKSEIEIDDRHWAIALPAKNPDAMRGFHASPQIPGDPDADALSEADLEWFAEQGSDESTRVLIIVDEAPGVDPRAFEALAGMATKPNVYQLWTGNPTMGADDRHPFAKACREGSRFHRIRVSSLPAKEYPPPPGIVYEKTFDHVPEYLVNPEDIEAAVRTYDKHDPILAADWAGNFASGSSEWNAVPRSALEAALGTRGANLRPIGPRIGVDIGSGSPDPCVASLFVDGVKRAQHTWSPPIDSLEGQVLTANTILALAEKWGEEVAADESTPSWVDGPIPGDRISIDDSGMVGVCDILASRGCYVDRVNFATGAQGVHRDVIGTQRFKNIRAELYWCARRLLQEGRAMIPRTYAESWDQLPWTRFFITHDSTGPIIQLEPKEKVVARNGRSPDIADADVLALRPTEIRPIVAGAGGLVRTPVDAKGRLRPQVAPNGQPIVGGRLRPSRLPGSPSRR